MRRVSLAVTLVMTLPQTLELGTTISWLSGVVTVVETMETDFTVPATPPMST